jgi:hypothetical protein
VTERRSYADGGTARGIAQWSLAIAVALASNSGAVARAQTERRVLVIPAQANEGGPEVAAEREARAALESLDGVALLPQPPLDLEAVQLAIDCPDESAKCLEQVAKRMKADVLIVPSVKRGDGALTLRLLCFDASAGAAPRALERKQRGGTLERETLDAVPGMVRELLGIEPESEPEPAPAAEPTEDIAPPTTQPTAVDEDQNARLPLAPVLVGAGGLSLVAAGLVVGAMMQSTQHSYAMRTIATQDDVLRAEEERQRGKDQALAANVLLGVGAAAVVGAGVWLAIELKHNAAKPAEPAADDGEEPQARLVPLLGAKTAGVALIGSFGEAR